MFHKDSQAIDALVATLENMHLGLTKIRFLLRVPLSLLMLLV
jgi:hypothetical protein